MKRLWTTVSVDDNLWKKFLSKAIEKYGPDVAKAKKKALDNAIKQWLERK
ncbi:MAG: hypothetical protein QMD12_00900 [Candidatus Aenigmarchaeota archaeon]|nr:hypothetical protein [Candidatus Aenigmarchaeota archaeon]